MGPPKQKWTQEEEAALKAGVDRYGPGKWSTILKDAEIAPLLAARSNVDLKDKWRNMNVGLGGHGSRQRSIKSVPKNAVVKGVKDSNSHMPAVALPNLSTEQLSTDTCSISGALVSSNGSEDMNLLEGDDRYNEWIVDAVKSTKDSNGCSPSTIAAIIEAHHPVPANFRKLLSMKLKDMVNQGSLIKIRQNFMLNGAEFAPSVIEQEGLGTQKAEMDASRGGLAAVMEVDSLVGRPLQAMNVGQPAVRSINNPTRGIVRVDGQQDLDKGKLLVEYTKTKARTAEEAARVAALAVAEAEAAAAAAEKATREAELAEEEAENAEIAAQKAAKDALIQKKGRLPVS